MRCGGPRGPPHLDRKSTRLNSSHLVISYAVFCLKKKEELLSDHLNPRVKVERTARRGRVAVEFATLEDLERIYKLMVFFYNDRGTPEFNPLSRRNAFQN